MKGEEDYASPVTQEKKTLWIEHKTPNRRIYYYNSISRVTLWTKLIPTELTPNNNNASVSSTHLIPSPIE